MELSELLSHCPDDVLDAYITERQPKRGEPEGDGWMLLLEPGPTRAEDQWVCLIANGEIWTSSQEPPDYGWTVDERGDTPAEAMAKGIEKAMQEIW